VEAGKTSGVTMTSDELVQALQKALGSNLKSVVLYGSAAAGDFVPDVSGHDIVVVTDRLGSADLEAVSETVRRWTKAGNSIPQLFTAQELLSSADVFPIELLDMQQSRRVLFGSDPLVDLKIDMQDYRTQLERELKVRLLLLRRRYVAANHDEQRIGELMIASLSTFLVLLRGVLRLYNEAVPATKAEAIDGLTKYVNLDPEPFRRVLALKQRSAKPAAGEMRRLFASYLQEIERLIHVVDHHLPAQPSGGGKTPESENLHG
jgi:hypothetical protein